MDKGLVTILLISFIIIIIMCIWVIAEAEGVTNSQVCSRCGSHSVVEVAKYNKYGAPSNSNVKTIKYKCNNCTYYYSVTK